MNKASEASTMSQIIASLCEDEECRDSMPNPLVSNAKSRAGISLAQMFDVIMEGYAARTALGETATELQNAAVRPYRHRNPLRSGALHP